MHTKEHEKQKGLDQHSETLRVLLLGDTHLGFDLPARPRVESRRRGPEFFRNFELALHPALDGQVDLVVHGGDVFFRSKVRTDIVTRTIDSLRAVTERGVPIFIVPGNHERSALPLPMLWRQPGLYVFDQPRSFQLDVRGMRVCLAGFPYSRACLPLEFQRLIAQTDWRDQRSDVRLLCMHQTVEGAVVGANNFVFRSGRDVIPGDRIPDTFAAILSGHIHRRQIRRHTLQGTPLATPVVYPGSTERTSFAEREETKGYVLLEIEPTPGGRGNPIRRSFRPLPTRPMVVLHVDVQATHGSNATTSATRLRRVLAALPQDAIVQVRARAELDSELPPFLNAPALREMAPPTMTIQLARPWQVRRSHLALSVPRR